MRLLTECGGVNVYDIYKTEFSTAALWSVTGVDGAVAPGLIVTPDDVLKAFELNIGASGRFNIGLQPVDALEAGGVLDFEGVVAAGVTVTA